MKMGGNSISFDNFPTLLTELTNKKPVAQVVPCKISG